MALVSLKAETVLPSDGTVGTLIGRVWRPDVDGPSVVVCRGARARAGWPATVSVGRGAGASADAGGHAAGIAATATSPAASCVRRRRDGGMTIGRFSPGFVERSLGGGP